MPSIPYHITNPEKNSKLEYWGSKYVTTIVVSCVVCGATSLKSDCQNLKFRWEIPFKSPSWILVVMHVSPIQNKDHTKNFEAMQSFEAMHIFSNLKEKGL